MWVDGNLRFNFLLWSVCVVGVLLRTLPRWAILFFELTQTHAPDIYLQLRKQPTNRELLCFALADVRPSRPHAQCFPLLFYLLTFVDLGPVGICCQRYVGHIYLYRARSSNYKHLWSVRSCHLQRPRKLNTRQSIYCIEAFSLIDARLLADNSHTSFDPTLAIKFKFHFQLWKKIVDISRSESCFTFHLFHQFSQQSAEDDQAMRGHNMNTYLKSHNNGRAKIECRRQGCRHIGKVWKSEASTTSFKRTSTRPPSRVAASSFHVSVFDNIAIAIKDCIVYLIFMWVYFWHRCAKPHPTFSILTSIHLFVGTVERENKIPVQMPQTNSTGEGRHRNR